ncbi:hypothetical protein NQ318_001918 [Aromia moschata]|uniref:Uncharacterized protein n=1 Tax=Aromia moschata TaxID=1265417 RepID=A0AAV8Z1B4_9CUCU|nr:hypothetical protein NQ318_001918 [Aromia moschata]
MQIELNGNCKNLNVGSCWDLRWNWNGYSDKVLQELARSSMGSSAYQLKTVLSKIVERGDTRKPDIVKKLKQLVTDLDEPHSYINEALKDIPALPFVL